ncbi:hypothetical protein FF86_103425 [Frankia sp. CpI1-P]|uniref:hypothetical protein n=1 Tax=unclassified Frankia TaxID=2632575 RepID=UPI0006FF35C6|nr:MULTISPECIES: hypothetical protein [unclassified Frankia]KQM03809.1 hypothetical protein FF86_103425 [Frankia sp. CpI1-P]
MSREPDTGVPDPQGDPIDADPIDGGSIDADPVDGGPVDGGPVDGGPVDGVRGAERRRADAHEASRLVSFGLRPRLVPARDPDYRDLVRRYLREAEFAALTQAIAAGLGLVVLDVSERAGLVPAGADDSAFAVRIGDYARRAGGEHRAADRLLHALAQLAVAALAYPRPADLADASYVGRVSVHGVDAFVRETCRLLAERTADDLNTDPPVDAPRLEAAWRLYSRRTSTGTTRDARRLAGSTTGIIARAMNFLVESGCLVPVGDEAGGTYRTTPRYQVQVRELAADAAFEELLALGVVTVTDGAGSVRVLVDEPALLETTPAGEAADV